MTRIRPTLANLDHLAHARRAEPFPAASSRIERARPEAAPIGSTVASIMALTGGASSLELREAAVKQSPEARAEAQGARAHFEQQFGALASDPESFHAMMKEVYGEGYDRAAAETMRAQAQAGDFSWLPKVEFVGDDVLDGGHGAYDSESGTVFLSTELLSDPKLAAATFMEEVGHHIDTKLNATDTLGDEGEMFRRLMSGEKLTAAQKAEIRNEDDKGIIIINGREVEVEFWKPFKKIGKALKKVGNGIKNAVKGVAKGVGTVFKGIGKGIGNVFKGIGQGVGGFLGNLFQGKIGDAFGSLWKGIDTAVFKSTAAVLDGVLDGTQTIFNGATELLPGFLKKGVRWVSDRGFDAVRSLATGAHGIVSGAANNLAEATGTFMGGIGKVFTGDFKGGFKDMGMGLLKGFVQTPVDAILLGLGRGVSAIQTLIGLEEPGRKLTDAEVAQLKVIYGDSIDYDQVRIKEGFAGLFSTNGRAFVHGNTIYMKDNVIDAELLAHEMMHVWQFQNGGSDYMSEALISQEWGKGYDWESSVPDTAWGDLEPEQQAEFIEAVWASGFFTDPSVTTFFHGGVDITDYVEDALAQIRNGDGAP